MAKKKSKNTSSGATSSPQPVARRSLPDINKIIRQIQKNATAKILSDRLRQIEDRRRFDPAGPRRSAKSFNKAHHSLVVKKSPRARVPTHVSFHAPKKVLICVRRQRRKEIMHAFKRAGKGGHRPPRRNWFSDVSCKR